MQMFLLELLSADGRSLVMSIMAQKNTLYPPGTEPLKCIVTNYSSLTGSDKWVLASFMLFVFKLVLQDVGSMVRDELLTSFVDLLGFSALGNSSDTERGGAVLSHEGFYRIYLA